MSFNLSRLSSNSSHKRQEMMTTSISEKNRFWNQFEEIETDIDTFLPINFGDSVCLYVSSTTHINAHSKTS